MCPKEKTPPVYVCPEAQVLDHLEELAMRVHKNTSRVVQDAKTLLAVRGEIEREKTLRLSEGQRTTDYELLEDRPDLIEKYWSVKYEFLGLFSSRVLGLLVAAHEPKKGFGSEITDIYLCADS